MDPRIARLSRRLDRLGWRAGLGIGAGTGAVAGLGLMQTGHWAGLAGAGLLLGGAAALAWTGEPVDEADVIDEPLQMIELSGGTFLMGSPETEAGRLDNEGPVHEVTVAAFAMARCPVTQELYQEVMGENPGRPEGKELPVNLVSWFDAMAFCNQLSEQVGLAPCYRIEGEQVTWLRQADGYRLPTEAEWEYAARAGSRRAYCFGDDVRKLGRYAWYRENSERRLQPVGQKKPSRWGLHDLHGNVWEWCWDFYDKYDDKGAPATDPVGPLSGKYHVLRGGSFVDGPRYLRSAYRNWRGPVYRVVDFGFRCVRGAGRQP